MNPPPPAAGDKTESIEWCDKDAPQLVAVEGEFVHGAQRPAQMYRAAVGFQF